MNRRLRSVSLPIAVIAVIAVAAVVVAMRTEADVPMVGERAPELSGTSLDDDDHLSLEQMRGDVVLVNMWASWCQPCEDEIPVLVEAQRRYGDSGLQVLGVNTQDGLRAAVRAAERWGADSYPNIFDKRGQIAVRWGVVGLPETYIVSADGEILERHFGPVTMDWLDDTLEPVIQP
jgi:DsbE subfamily thiol:disulfide oxidoreductase